MPALTPSTNALAVPAEIEPALPKRIPAVNQDSPPPTPADENAVIFIVQWMERGGGDPIGKEALLYPRGNIEELRKLRDLVMRLEIDPLIARTNQDLAASTPKFCSLCNNSGEYTHMKDVCPKLRAKAEREARQKEERRQEKKRIQEEEEAQKLLRYKISIGQVAVGD
ncbi:MAG: hypothetical protein Q9175_004599, partial [Cornicularia normoerica]